MPLELENRSPYRMIELKSTTGLIPLSEALILLVKHAQLGWETDLIFRCENCTKPQEYPKNESQGESLVECCYCSQLNYVENVSLKTRMVDQFAG